MTGRRPGRTVETSPDLDLAGTPGTIRHATVYSEHLGGRADCTFWRPPGTGALPLVILLHGVYGSHWAWATNGAAGRTAARLIEDGDLPRVALAMPSDGLFGHGSGYVAHAGGDFERWVVDEVPRLAEEVVDGVSADRPVAMIGLSMGGFGALRLGLVHPERVVAAAGMSSITAWAQMEIFVGPLDRFDLPDEPTVIGAATRCPPDGRPALYIDCGRDDLLIEHNRRLHDELAAAGIAHTWEQPPGRHEWAYWRERLPHALRFVGSHVGR